MTLFISQRKLKAAASSMHQFCPAVKAISPEAAPDDVVEVWTVYLYEHVAAEVFGRRFLKQLRGPLRRKARHNSPEEMDARVHKVQRLVENYQKASEDDAPPNSDSQRFTHYVQSVLRALLAEAGTREPDMMQLRRAYERFESAVRTLKMHLSGIKQQSPFIMR